MHGFHVRYYADEKGARQAATIRTTSAYHRYHRWPLCIAVNPSLSLARALALHSAARSTCATCGSCTTRSTPPRLLARSTSCSRRSETAARRRWSPSRCVRRIGSLGFGACARPSPTTRYLKRCDRSAAPSWRRRWTTASPRRRPRARPNPNPDPNLNANPNPHASPDPNTIKLTLALNPTKPYPYPYPEPYP